MPLFAGAIPCGACSRPIRSVAGAPVQPERPFARVNCTSCGKEQTVYRFEPYRISAPVQTALLQEPGAAGPPTALPPCAYHAGNVSVGTCARCGSFLCGLCVTAVQGQTYCTACFERLLKGEKAPGARPETLQTHYARPHTTAIAAAFGVLILPYIGLALVPVVFWTSYRAIRQRVRIREIEDANAVLYAIAAIVVTVLAFLVQGFMFLRRGR